MFAYEGKDEVLPDLICVAFGELESERGTLSMFSIFPNGLDTSDEKVDRGAFGHLVWSLQVLVHTPKLIYRVKVGQWLDILLIPTVGLVLSVECVGMS